MVKGVSYYAKRWSFQADAETLIRFLSRVLLNEYPRAKEVAYLPLDELKSRVFSTHLVNTSPTTRKGVLRFIKEVVSKYDRTSNFSERSPGFGEPEFINSVLKFAGEIDKALNQTPETTPNILEARVVIASLILTSLESPQEDVIETSKMCYQIERRVSQTPWQNRLTLSKSSMLSTPQGQAN